jgi:hypothetical protein
VTLDPALLEQAIRRSNGPAVRDLLRHATESERTACARALSPLFTRPGLPPDVPLVLATPDLLTAYGLPPGTRALVPADPERDRQWQAAYSVQSAWDQLAGTLAFQLARLGLAGGPVAAVTAARGCQAHRTGAGNDGFTLVTQILADRAPAWLAEFADRLLEAADRLDAGVEAWPLARDLVRRGLIARPAVPPVRDADARQHGDPALGRPAHSPARAGGGAAGRPRPAGGRDLAAVHGAGLRRGADRRRPPPGPARR